MSMTVEKAIDELGGYIGVFDDIYDYELKELWPALELAVVALREKAERENPAPLTMEELVMMDCEPVWIRDKHSSGYEFSADAADYFEGRNPKEYGKTWVAYRHKPKEEVQ